MASIVHRNSTDHGAAHCWTLEKVLDESQHTGELNLSGRNLKEFPEDATHFEIEDTIVADLSRNKFVEIPCDICTYSSIEWLNCYSNVIKFIPNTVLQLHNLVYLNLSRNQLSVLPTSICGLTQLQVLSASHNRLTELPEEINELLCLTELDVSCNELVQLPDKWNDLQTLRRLDVRRNRLTQLPISLSGLKLQYLNISCNGITRLPTEFHQLSMLEDFDVEYNPLAFPPLHVCRKGLNHVLKYLAVHSKQQQNKHVVRTKYKRPSALLAKHIEKTSRSCDNFDQCYTTSHVLESGYSTADSCEKLRIPSNEDSAVETRSYNDSQIIVEDDDCVQLECQHYFEQCLTVHRTVSFENDSADFIPIPEDDLLPIFVENVSCPLEEEQNMVEEFVQDLRASTEPDVPDVNELPQNDDVTYCNFTSATLRSLLEFNLKAKLSGDLSTSVCDGVVLCQLINVIRPNSISDVCTPSPGTALTSSESKMNVNKFLRACRNVGVRECYLCSCEDVVDGLRHPERLLITIEQLLSYPPVSSADHVISALCLIGFCVACTLLAIFPLPN